MIKKLLICKTEGNILEGRLSNNNLKNQRRLKRKSKNQ